MTMLQVEALTKKYPAFTLQDVGFSLEAGRIMGLIGRNGAGKSTTLKAMLHLVCPDHGKIHMLGRDFAKEEKACKQELGVVLGGVVFYQTKTLHAITGVTRRFYPNWDEAAYQKYLRFFELDEQKQIRQLSEGMKVKYSLTLALSHGARLFLLDEPTSGLDPVAREELLELFRQLVRDGDRSILFSTHITSDLEQCADDITYIRNGRVVASADRESFIRSFQNLKPSAGPALTLEQIMVNCEKEGGYDSFAL